MKTLSVLIVVLLAGCGFGGGGVTPVRTSFNKGVYHYARGNFDAAIAEYRLALEENERDHRARYNLAVALETKAARLRHRGEATRAAELERAAEEEYRALIEERPEFLRAIVNLAACEYARGLHAEATARLEGAIERFDSALPCVALAAHRFRPLRGAAAPAGTQADFEAVLAALDQGLSRDPASLEGNLLRGEVQALLGQQARSPGAAAGTSVLGLDAAAHFDAARRAYGAALEREPSDMATLMALGRLEGALENWGAAAALFERVIFIDADHFAARLALSEVLTHAGELERAAFHLARARELDHARPPALAPAEYRRRLTDLYERLAARERAGER